MKEYETLPLRWRGHGDLLHRVLHHPSHGAGPGESEPRRLLLLQAQTAHWSWQKDRGALLVRRGVASVFIFFIKFEINCNEILVPQHS